MTISFAQLRLPVFVALFLAAALAFAQQPAAEVTPPTQPAPAEILKSTPVPTAPDAKATPAPVAPALQTHPSPAAAANAQRAARQSDDPGAIPTPTREPDLSARDPGVPSKVMKSRSD